MKGIFLHLMQSGMLEPAFAADVLHIYNANNFIGPQTLQRFEAAYKGKVDCSTYGSNEELLAKLVNANPVHLNSAFVLGNVFSAGIFPAGPGAGQAQATARSRRRKCPILSRLRTEFN